MTMNTLAEWRGWIWVGIVLLTSMIGGGFGLYAKANDHTDRRIDAVTESTDKKMKNVKDDIQNDLTRMGDDIREIRKDIKLLLQK